MHFLDICDDVLLDILSLVDPVDLVNISNVCERLRALAERFTNKVLNLHLTGIDCFPNLKPQPFANFERIRVNKNWLDGKFTSKPLLQYNDLDLIGMVVDEHLYVAVNGAILKYDRLWNNEYLSSKCKLLGKKNHSKITAFAKKDNVIFAGCRNGACIIFEDDKPVMKKTKVSRDPFRAVDLFPKKGIYVAAFSNVVKLWNKTSNDETLLLVNDINTFGMEMVKIDPSGKKLIMCTGGDHVTLYDFNTQIKEVCLELENPWDLLWKNNQTILSGHQDGSLKLFDLRTKSVCQQIDQLRKEFIASIQFDGKNAVLCGLKAVQLVFAIYE